MKFDILSGLVTEAGPHAESVFERFVMMEPLALQRMLTERQARDVQAVDMSAGPAADMEKYGLLRLQGRTAVVPFVGLANKRLHAPPYLASYIATSAAVRAAAADKRVDAILLKVDSPGGYVSGIADAADDIRAAAQTKPVIAQIDGLGASAAYWIASQATEVYAGRLDEVGSIGVIGVLYDVSKAFADAGIKTEVFATGKYKWTGVTGTELSDDQREYLQQGVDELGDAFIADVARGRRVAEEDIRKVADGRVFSARDAHKYKLIDGIRTYADSLALLEATSKRDRALRSARLDVAREKLAQAQKKC